MTTIWLDVLLRSSAVLIVAFAALFLLRRRSAALRHAVLAGAVGAAALVAPLSLVSPDLPVAMPIAVPMSSPPAPDTLTVEAPTGPAVPSRVGDDGGGQIAVGPLLASLWALGTTSLLGALVFSILRVRSISAQATVVRDGPWAQHASDVASAVALRRPVALLRTDTSTLLATWGVAPARILLPKDARDWDPARIHAVLCHELAHVARRDWLVQITSEVLRALYWFNPLFWIACRRLRLESERACDDVVLGLGIDAPDYATHLVDVARSSRASLLPVAAVVPMARMSTLERRIAAMLNPRLNRRPVSGTALIVTIAALLALAAPIAALRATQGAARPLAGVVYDPSGGVLPEVALTLEDERQNKWQTTSDSAGRFEFPAVGAGKYSLGASLRGFRPLSQPVELSAAGDWNRAVTLQVGTVQETITVRESRIKTARAPQVSAPTPVRVGGNIKPPTKLHDVKPIYPASMREAGVEGEVPLDAIIGTDGAVVSVRVTTAQVHPDLAQAAADAVRQWRFTPTLLNGRPVEVVMTVSVSFQLED